MSRSWPVALALATFLAPAAFAQQPPPSPNLAAVQCEMAKTDANFAAYSWANTIDAADKLAFDLKKQIANLQDQVKEAADNIEQWRLERDTLAAKLKDAEAGKAPEKTE